MAGEARRGESGLGMVRQGKARPGLAGMSWHGEARLGMARRGRCGVSGRG